MIHIDIRKEILQGLKIYRTQSYLQFYGSSYENVMTQTNHLLRTLCKISLLEVPIDDLVSNIKILIPVNENGERTELKFINRNGEKTKHYENQLRI